jgi:hypothetical protein
VIGSENIVRLENAGISGCQITEVLLYNVLPIVTATSTTVQYNMMKIISVHVVYHTPSDGHTYVLYVLLTENLPSEQ